MIPVIFRVPGLGWDLPGYGLALMIGFLLSVMWAARRAERSRGDPEIVLNCGFFALLGGVVGARAMYVYHYWEQFGHRGSLRETISAILDVRQGGLEVYGGFITVVILVFGYLWLTKRSIRWYLDIIAPSAALGMAIGRIGCFLNGCCHGGVCDLPWAVRFPFGSPAAAQQWTDLKPGAGLPQQLLVFPDKGVYPNGLAATPIPREILINSPKQIEATHQAALKVKADRAKLVAQIAQTSAAEQKKQLQAELDTQDKQQSAAVSSLAGLGCAAPPLLTVRQMEKYGLRADELRALAALYPSLPVHPTQLYSTITLGLLAALLSALYWRRTRDGQVICTLLLIEPWTRWMLEILRADNPVDTLGTFTVSQFLGICLSVVGLLGLLALRKLPPRSARAVLWEPPAVKAPR
jgi:phosphatidylglycerol:prolipoprotein diacylglycerol transferase